MITFHKENLWKTLKDEDDNFALSKKANELAETTFQGRKIGGKYV